jgi:ribosome biogenesis GTPase
VSLATGLVIRVDSKVCWVRLTDPDGGALLKCPIRGRLFQAESSAKNPVAVGDRVRVSPGESENEGRVDAVEPRRNRLSKPVADSAGRREQVVVANVDYLAIVVSAARPPLRPGLIDRFLIAAGRQGIEPVVIVNKIDLVDRDELEAEMSAYAGLGKRLVYTSALKPIGLERLRRLLAGRQTVFVGHSGVGKSSLLNALLPDLGLRTRDVSRKSGRGVHTTTQVVLYEFDEGGSVIDTPGVRAVGLWNVEPEDVDVYFEEITTVSEGCRFRGCTHRHEPDCAVEAAVEKGEIDPRRFASYLRIVESLEEERRERGY